MICVPGSRGFLSYHLETLMNIENRQKALCLLVNQASLFSRPVTCVYGCSVFFGPVNTATKFGAMCHDWKKKVLKNVAEDIIKQLTHSLICLLTVPGLWPWTLPCPTPSMPLHAESSFLHQSSPAVTLPLALSSLAHTRAALVYLKGQ